MSGRPRTEPFPAERIVPCPTCCAAKGSRCTSSAGRQTTHPHLSRVAAAIEQCSRGGYGQPLSDKPHSPIANPPS